LLIKTKIKLFLELKELEIEQIQIGTLEKELFMLLSTEAKISPLFGEELPLAMVTEELFLPDSLRTYHQRLLDQLYELLYSHKDTNDKIQYLNP
jgi:hypothetical protein